MIGCGVTVVTLPMTGGMPNGRYGVTERTVLFVCEHGAGRSRMAAAWFNHAPPPGWRATTAGIEPQPHVSVHAPRLLAGTPAEATLDHAMPRPVSAVPDPAVVIAIDCMLPDAVAWRLDACEFDEAMSAEIRQRVAGLVASITDVDPV
jgi:hypothetical protein